MSQLIWVLLAMGVALIIAGAALMGTDLPFLGGMCLFLGAVLALVHRLSRLFRAWQRGRHLRAANPQLSETARTLTPQLFGEYSPYIIEAAAKLAAERDMSAVPALLVALQGCVDQQRPGWRDVAEALVLALARIGDRRALEVLYRLENVRGIGIIPAIRTAIASLEPQTSLLRPACSNDSLPETLLRPAHAVPEGDPALLLRPTTLE